jgi:3-keto-disaccharide hydrolase/FG-GAP-like repeat
MFGRIAVVLVLGITLTAAPPAGTRGTFVPDWTFKGAALTGWHPLGHADWRAVDGVVIGTPKSPEGGWLVLDRPLQDVQVGFDVRCTGACRIGVLLRAEKTADGGLKGIFTSLSQDDINGYAVTIDAGGRELTRERLRPGGGMMRFAPTVAEAAAAAAAAAGRGGGAGRGGAGRGAQPGPLRPDDWNDVEIVLDANILRPIVNGRPSGGGAADEEGGKFGPIAIYVGGSGEARFRDVSYKDLGMKRFAKEQLSPHFRLQRLTPYYYSFSAAAADINRDGHMDIVSGPFIFFGPDFTQAREFYAAQTTNPSTAFSQNWVAFAGDFTGDGWPGVLLASTDNNRLYINPKGEARRWDVYPNVIPPANQSEISMMKDLDDDGKPELIYASAGAVRFAKPDPANPTGPWLSTQVGEAGSYTAHGIGAGDINGDGRQDILNSTGWWEQPSAGAQQPIWAFHAAPFGRGGAEMAVYDVNGDGLTDVVTSLQAHGFGLAWFEQKRDAGNITFVEHPIAGNFASDNAGDVTFSEPHGSTSADIDHDGVPDFIVGKRFFSHHESFLDPDPYGAPVLYVYRTVRNPKAPGGAEFVPELVHNQSGAGSQVLAVDLNEDGVVDLVTSTTQGAFVFFNTRKPAATTRRSQRGTARK